MAPSETTIRTETLSPSAAFDAGRRAAAQAWGSAGDEGFRSGALTPAALRAICHFIDGWWRPSLTGRAHQGHLAIPTREGDRRITQEELPVLFGVQAEGEPAAVSGRTISRFLEVYGAGWAHANGRPDRPARVADLVIILLGAARSLSPGGLRQRALGTVDEPGPAWAQSLRRPEPSEAQRKAKWLATVRADVDLTVLPADVWAQRHVPRSKAFLRTVTAADVAALHRVTGAALRRSAQRAAPPAEDLATAA